MYQERILREILERMEIVMANLADTVLEIQTQVTALQSAVAGIQGANLTPVETAIANVQTTVNAIEANLTPTPPAPPAA